MSRARRIGGKAAHQRRGAADRGEHRQAAGAFAGRAADTRATFRGRNSSLVRIFGFFGNKYSPYPLVALFSLNLQTLHEKHSMASWLRLCTGWINK